MPADQRLSFVIQASYPISLHCKKEKKIGMGEPCNSIVPGAFSTLIAKQTQRFHVNARVCFLITRASSSSRRINSYRENNCGYELNPGFYRAGNVTVPNPRLFLILARDQSYLINVKQKETDNKIIFTFLKLQR